MATKLSLLLTNALHHFRRSPAVPKWPIGRPYRGYEEAHVKGEGDDKADGKGADDDDDDEGFDQLPPPPYFRQPMFLNALDAYAPTASSEHLSDMADKLDGETRGLSPNWYSRQVDGCLFYYLDMPGVNKEEVVVFIKVDIKDGASVATIRAHGSESGGPPRFQFELPANAIKLHEIEAKMTHDMLTIKVPGRTLEEREDFIIVKVE